MRIQTCNTFPEVTLALLNFTQSLYSQKIVVVRKSPPLFHFLEPSTLLSSWKWHTARTTLSHISYIKFTVHFFCDSPKTCRWSLCLPETRWATEPPNSHSLFTNDQQKYLFPNASWTQRQTSYSSDWWRLPLIIKTIPTI